MSKKSFEELQARYVAGDRLSNEEASRLRRWLSGDQNRRHEMLAEEAVDNQLRCLARLGDRDSTEKFIRKTVERATSSEHRDDDLHVVPTLEKNRRRSFQLLSVPVVLSTAAVILVGVAITWYSTISPNRADFGFATITNTEDLTWELIDAEHRRLRVTSGYGEVHFENGTIAKLSAPAVIELKSKGGMFVENGSINVSVPPAGIGFTVETPLARIVDYGTKFDVAVGDLGQTETRVRSGTVTFEANPTRFTPSDPIKLTANGLNRASTVTSELTTEVDSVATTASGSQGQFYGTIYADGETAVFTTRLDFVDFLSRLHSSLERDSSQFHEQWQVVLETTANGTGTTVESSSGGGVLNGFPVGNAHEMMIKQLRAMQGIHHGNPQIQQLLEGMILQAEEVHGEISD